MSPPIYYLQAIRKEYGARCVLNIHELRIHPGELVAIVGPNGAGKSTLLRLLHFLETPDHGSIAFLGRNSTSPPLEVRRQIAMVFQRPILLDTTVRSNVAYGLRLRGLNHRGAVETILAELDLSPLADAPARTLSGGEMQRVALARALVLQPRVLLLDEPTANLDPYNAALIERRIMDLRDTRATTIVLVTHHVMQARRLADRVGLLLAGETVELAAVEDFFTNPADPRTRAFLSGEMIC